MSLNTSRILRRRAWTVLPMPQSVIDRVNAMASDQPRLITFVDKHGIKIGDIGDDTDTINPPETQYEIPGVMGDITQIPGVDTANAIEDTAVDDDNEVTEAKMNDLINIPEQKEPPLVEDSGNEFEPATDQLEEPTMDI